MGQVIYTFFRRELAGISHTAQLLAEPPLVSLLGSFSALVAPHADGSLPSLSVLLCLLFSLWPGWAAVPGCASLLPLSYFLSLANECGKLRNCGPCRIVAWLAPD